MESESKIAPVDGIAAGEHYGCECAAECMKKMDDPIFKHSPHICKDFE